MCPSTFGGVGLQLVRRNKEIYEKSLHLPVEVLEQSGIELEVLPRSLKVKGL